MAVELFGPSNTASSPDTPPSSRGMSPRISFSHDLCQYDVVPIEPPSSLSPSSSANFIFSNGAHFAPSSSADELFSNGVLLPLRPKPTSQPPLPLPPPPPQPPAIPDDLHKQSMKSSSSSSTTSFWKFKRSRSFNCGNIYGGTLCPLLLSRSKSTGSNSSSKRSLVPKDDHRNPSTGAGNCSRFRNPPPQSYQKPPLKKSFSGAGVAVSPVLNVSSGNLFGLGSIFSSMGKSDKISKKNIVN